MTKYPIPLRGIAVKSAGAALNYLAGGGYAPYETGIIVTAAALKMCPDVMPIVNAIASHGGGSGLEGV